MSHTCLHSIFLCLFSYPEHCSFPFTKPARYLPSSPQQAPVQNLALLSAEFWTLFLLVFRYVFKQLPLYQNKQLYIHNINGPVLDNDPQPPRPSPHIEPIIRFIEHTFQNIFRRKKKMYKGHFFILKKCWKN